MATVSVIKLKVRRGTDFDRKQITLDVGEVGYVQDAASRRLFVGDGSTRGGNPAGMKFYTGDIVNDPTNLTTTQVGDIVYNTYDSKLYCLTGVDTQNFPDYDNQAAYQYIGTRVDNSSIEYNGSGYLQVKDNGVSREKVNNNLFDTTQGLGRTVAGTVYVKYDNDTVKVNPSGQLYVDPNRLFLGDIAAVDQSVNCQKIILYNLPSSSSGLAPGQLWRDAASGGVLRVV